jgi:leucyl-tRNA synthetase
VTHTLWSSLGYAGALGDLVDAAWPAVDPVALERSEIELVLQVGGKLRGSLQVPADADRATIEAAALAHPDCIRFVDGRQIRRVVIVPGRLVNVVV